MARSALPLLAALAFSSSAAAATAAPPALIGALSRDGDVASCARESGKTVRAYAGAAFTFHEVTLRSGQQMAVAEAADACLSRGQSVRIFVFERTPAGYRRVLNDVTIPDLATVNDDGTIVLPTHDTLETILESTYVWNGSTYVFSRAGSHLYDVTIGQRRPFTVPLRFAAGTFATTLRGSFAYNFGQDYDFEARAGQHVRLRLVRHGGPRPSVVLSFGEGKFIDFGDLHEGDVWSGVLPGSGRYTLSVFGSNASDAERLSPYVVSLEIR